MTVPGFGDGAEPPPLPAAVFTRHQPDEGHQLARRDEAMEGVELEDDRRRGDGVEASKAAEHAHRRRVALLLGYLSDLDRQRVEALLELFDREQVVGEDDLVAGVREAKRVQPLAVHPRPGALSTRENQASA